MKVMSTTQYDCEQYTNATFNEIIAILKNYFGDKIDYTISPNNELTVYPHGLRGRFRLFLRINDFLVWGHEFIDVAQNEEFESDWKKVSDEGYKLKKGR